jgi:hypothetical protein
MPNPPIRTPSKSKEAARYVWLYGNACSRISGIDSGFCVTRADMESAHEAPIGTSCRKSYRRQFVWMLPGKT